MTSPTYMRVYSFSNASFLGLKSCSVVKTAMEYSLPLVTIRRCLYRDLDGILPIYNYSVSNTITSLDLDPKPHIYMLNLYELVLNQDLPFLVATTSNDHHATRNKEEILGYAYANFYRRLPAFDSTVEVLVYIDPGATGRGVGKRLLNVLLDMLRRVGSGTDREHGIREVLAIVPVNEGQDTSHIASFNFFLKAGFEDRGLLRGVAWKMGRWIDTRTFQRSLWEEPADVETVVHKEREPDRHWWSFLVHRRRRRLAQQTDPD